MESREEIGQDGAVAMRDILASLDRIGWEVFQRALEREGSFDGLIRKIEWYIAQRANVKYKNKTKAALALKRTYRWIRKLEKDMIERGAPALPNLVHHEAASDKFEAGPAYLI